MGIDALGLLVIGVGWLQYVTELKLHGVGKMLARVLLVLAGLLLGVSGVLANGLADMASNGRVVAWNAHYAFILTPGEQAVPLPAICIITPATIVAGSDALALYQGSYIIQAWFLDSNGHRWYFDEVAGCSDKGIL